MKNSKGKYAIIDFGLSRRIDLKNEQQISSFLGTPRFASISAHKNQAQTE
jgi:serine/threonine protein kinase